LGPNATTAGSLLRLVSVSLTNSAPPEYIVPAAHETRFYLGGYVQINAEFGDVSAYQGQWKESPAQPSSQNDRFRLRRARIGAWGDISPDFDFKIMGDFGQGDGVSSSRSDFSGTDIFINWHTFPEFNIKLGQFDTPFGMEQFCIPDMMTLTPERSAVTEALRPERQIGVMVWGNPFANILPEHKNLVTYYLGVFNGNGRNITANDNDSFMYMGRLEFTPFQGKLWGQDASWKLGVDGYSSRDGTNTVVTPVGNALVNKDGSLSSMSVQTHNDQRDALGLDQRFNWGRWTVQGEYLQTHFKNTLSADPDFTSSGYWGLVAFQIVPKKLEWVEKYESFRPDQRADDDFDTITSGLNWYIKGRDIVLMLDYMHTTSHYRESNSDQGQNQFNEVMLRTQFNF
jgi:phosphate-selective porin